MLKTHNPLFIPLLFMIGGILIAEKISLEIMHGLGILGVLSVLFISSKKRLVKSLLLPLIFFLVGILSIIVNVYSSDQTHFSNRDSDFLYATISSKESTKKGFRYFANVNATVLNTREYISSGKIMIYADSTVELTQYNTYQIASKQQPISIYNNPGRFDYGEYLAKQDIYHRVYLKEGPVLIEENIGMLALLRDVRRAAIGFFAENLSSKDNASVVNAILLGDKRNMDKSIRAVFINNGLAHLLAISGMHVGIILLILNFVFAQLPSRVIKNLLVILGIWLYILLSGLQIPAIRAGFMFTIYVIGQVSNRNIKSLNSVFFAAMVLLALNPKMIYQLSFQLSFTAMISILIYYKKIFQLFVFESVFLIKVWQLVSLNFSVQILVLPLSIYYFEQLPVYSMFSSIISIPFMIVLMWGGTLALLLSSFNILTTIICTVLNFVIKIYLILLDFIATLPYSLIEDLQIHDLQLIFWIIGSLSFYFFYSKRRPNKAIACASFAPLILFSSILNMTDRQVNEIIIYDDPKQIIIDHHYNQEIVRYKEDLNLSSYQVEGNETEKVDVRVVNQNIAVAEKQISLITQEIGFRKSKITICIVYTEKKLSSIEKHCEHIIIPRTIITEHEYTNQYSILKQGAFTLKF